MKDWKEYKLGDVANVQTGPFGSQLHMSDYKPTGTPIITVEHLGDNKVLHKNLPLVGDEDKNRLKKYTLKKGDIVFSRVGSVDRCAYISEQEDGWMFSGRLLRVRVNEGIIYSRYLSYYFSQFSFKETIRMIAVGATMPSINTSLLSEVDITLPPLPTQKAIATILSRLDAKIDLLHHQNQTLEQLAETLFMQKVVEDKKDNWQETSLDQIATYLNGLACQKYPANGLEFLPVIKIRELRTGITSASDKADIKIPSNYIIEDGDVLFSWSGSLEVVIWNGGKGALNQHLFKVSSEDYPKWFYYLWTKYHLEDFRAVANDKATTMGHIQRHHLKEAVVFVPTNSEMKKLETTFQPIIDKIIYNSQQIKTLTQLRDSLLPQLISGAVRVK